MIVHISGSHGLIGSALSESFTEDGIEVRSLGRSFDSGLRLSQDDVVVHLAGESIAEGRWNKAKKDRIKKSRLEGTAQLARQIAQSKIKPSVLVCASAIGFYGDRGEELLSEDSSPGEGFLPEVCNEWEQATECARDAGTRTVNLRTGIVLSEKGGALKKMLTPFKIGAGGILGDGRQYMSWISMADMIRAIHFVIENTSCAGPVNVTAPNPVTNKEFTKTLGRILHRPTSAPMPAFAARILFGEMADALLLSGARVIPTKLIREGYEFKHERLEDALRDILK